MRIALLDVKKATGLNSKFTAVNVRNLLLIKRYQKIKTITFRLQQQIKRMMLNFISVNIKPLAHMARISLI